MTRYAKTKGCTIGDHPPGITVTSVTLSDSNIFTFSFRWDLSMSQVERFPELFETLRRIRQTFLIYNFTPFSSIHPSSAYERKRFLEYYILVSVFF
ncbi:hypothetical protein TNCV_5040801 [Trichonephila clavipes]|nr:hypothetical protein TNCV_5040801 [Trichonephila clavipes]